MSLKERFEKYQAQKQKEEEEFNELSSYETDSVKSEEEYVIDPWPVEVFTENKSVAIIKHEKEPISEDFAMKAINEAFNEQEYENLLNEYDFSTKEVIL